METEVIASSERNVLTSEIKREAIKERELIDRILYPRYCTEALQIQ